MKLVLFLMWKKIQTARPFSMTLARNMTRYNTGKIILKSSVRAVELLFWSVMLMYSSPFLSSGKWLGRSILGIYDAQERRIAFRQLLFLRASDLSIVVEKPGGGTSDLESKPITLNECEIQTAKIVFI